MPLQNLRGIPDDDQCMWGMLAHLSGILAPFVGPLVVWFIKREESEFVAYHAAQALYWSLVTWVGIVLISVLTCGGGAILFPGFWLAALYVGLQAKEGSWTGYWFIHQHGYGGKLL